MCAFIPRKGGAAWPKRIYAVFADDKMLLMMLKESLEVLSVLTLVNNFGKCKRSIANA
jgi:hypothetical protein